MSESALGQDDKPGRKQTSPVANAAKKPGQFQGGQRAKQNGTAGGGGVSGAGSVARGKGKQKKNKLAAEKKANSALAAGATVGGAAKSQDNKVQGAGASKGNTAKSKLSDKKKDLVSDKSLPKT